MIELDDSEPPLLATVCFPCQTEKKKKSQKRQAKNEQNKNKTTTSSLLALISLHKGTATLSFAALKSKMVGYFIFSVFDLTPKLREAAMSPCNPGSLATWNEPNGALLYQFCLPG